MGWNNPMHNLSDRFEKRFLKEPTCSFKENVLI